MEYIDQIIDILFKQGETSTSQMADLLGVSVSTVRREVLERADARIKILKNHIRISKVVDDDEISVHRLPIDQNEIRSIANYAVKLIEQGDVIAISGGQICAELTQRVKFLKGITVVTNAINVAAELVGVRGIEMMVTGGVLNPNSFELVGVPIRCSLEHIHINKFFLGTDGLSVEHGITGHDLAEAQTARDIKEFSDKTYVLADSSKFGKANFAKVCGVAEVDAIVTTQKTPRILIEQIRAVKIPCLMAELP